MRLPGVSSAALALWAVLASVAAQAAAPLPEFNAAVEDAASHNRVALGYLRTGNIDLAQLELDRLRASWMALVDKYGGNRPDVFDQTLYTTTLTDISLKITAADMLMKSGRPEATQQSLTGIRDALSNLRRKSGVPVLADCVLDSNSAMAALGELDRQPVDWSTGVAAKIETTSAAYATELRRCDEMAPDAVRSSAEFRRLIDGALASLALVSKSIVERDGDLFHRVVIELRSFDNLLTFRFG
jgi:hypothetical protein